MSIRALIVDDEPLARKGLRSLLKNETDIAVSGEAANGLEAVEIISSRRPDLVFLDVQMPGLDGFGVIEAVGVNRMPFIIFVTAYDLHALQAFQVHAVDYLLKPVKADQFAAALNRARTLLGNSAARETAGKLVSLLETLNSAREYRERFIIKSTGKVTIVKVADLDYVAADGDYVRLYSRGKYQLLRERISGLERQLDPAQFIRIHRSLIVRIDCIKELRPLVNGDHLLLLNDGTQLSLSRTYREKVLSALGWA